MTNLHVHDTTGQNCMILNCPMCDFQEEVYYATKPPKYCSNACKQRAARKRKKKRQRMRNVSQAIDTYLPERQKKGELVQCQCICGWEIIIPYAAIDALAVPKCPNCNTFYNPKMVVAW